MDIPGDNPEQKTFHSSEPHTPTKQKKKKKEARSKVCLNSQHSQRLKKQI